MDLVIREASDQDRNSIITLLMDNMLPTADLQRTPVLFFVATANNRILGTIGLENYGTLGLLRSLAVAEDVKKKGVGEQLVRHLINYCVREGIGDLYLLTTTAAQYFPRHGFSAIDRELAPASIRQTVEFTSLCPSSAVVMHQETFLR